MKAAIVRIDGTVVSRGGVRRRKVPEIPPYMEIPEDWYERKLMFYGERFNKIKTPPWLRLLLIGKQEIPPAHRRAAVYWMSAVMSWLGFTREEILIKLSRLSVSELGANTLRYHINSGFSSEQYGRNRR